MKSFEQTYMDRIQTELVILTSRITGLESEVQALPTTKQGKVRPLLEDIQHKHHALCNHRTQAGHQGVDLSAAIEQLMTELAEIGHQIGTALTICRKL